MTLRYQQTAKGTPADLHTHTVKMFSVKMGRPLAPHVVFCNRLMRKYCSCCTETPRIISSQR
uniref:Uncharacterized protein n=1 Tax=Anguilla anguilla TaxID=7936 RepID=A0A0E9ULV6_ANGAN